MFSFHTRIRSDQSKMPRTDIIVEWVTSGFVDDIVTEWADRVERAHPSKPRFLQLNKNNGLYHYTLP